MTFVKFRHVQYSTLPIVTRNPITTLSSVEYNWPLIHGSMSTYVECKATYIKFFILMFIIVILCVFVLPYLLMCLQIGVGGGTSPSDVNQFHESHHAFLLLLKLQYWPTRWTRMVEAMAIAQFIARAHKCFINEILYTNASHFERLLRWIEVEYT